MIALEWTVIGIIVVGIVLGIIFRDTPFVQKNWGYGLIALVVLLFTVADVIRRMSGQKDTEADKVASQQLESNIQNIKGNIEEANKVAIIQTAAAQAKDQAKIDELKAVRQIPDTTERRRRLAEMVG